MSDFDDQIKALKQRMEARHIETLARLEAQRAENKTDLKAFREDIIQALERQELRNDSRLEGLQATLKEDMAGMNTELSMLYGLVTNALSENQRLEGRREDSVQSCVNQVRNLEHRVSELEKDRPPAA